MSPAQYSGFFVCAILAQIGRPDWSRNAAALTDMNWWKGTLKPRPAVDWYLERVAAAMDELKREVDGAPITMLCHSVRRRIAAATQRACLGHLQLASSQAGWLHSCALCQLTHLPVLAVRVGIGWHWHTAGFNLRQAAA
jgi:hypothetical protein